jgi:hypothetical protein
VQSSPAAPPSSPASPALSFLSTKNATTPKPKEKKRRKIQNPIQILLRSKTLSLSGKTLFFLQPSMCAYMCTETYKAKQQTNQKLSRN